MSSISRANGATTTASYATGSQNWSLTQDAATGQDVSRSYTPNAAGQTQARSPDPTNSAYNYAPPTPGTAAYGRNGLNQITNVGGVSYSSDARGNLASDGTRGFCYDLENQLTAVRMSGTLDCVTLSAATQKLRYDPGGRLREFENVGGATTQFLYDGSRLVAEYDNTTGQLLRRYAHGAGVDEPVVWYEGSGLATRNYLHTDEMGTVVATSDNSGNVSGGTIYAYDAYGRPANDNWAGSRFRYTGQIAMPEVKLYYYKARMYDPVLGRFLQTDPIGYAAGDMNLYAYVGNDPVNRTDPLGLETYDGRSFQPNYPIYGWGLDFGARRPCDSYVCVEPPRMNCNVRCQEFFANDYQTFWSPAPTLTPVQDVQTEMFTADDIEDLYKNMDECSTCKGSSMASIASSGSSTTCCLRSAHWDSA